MEYQIPDEAFQQARKDIEQIDEQIAALFEKRMQAAERIGTYKEERQLPVRDEKREAALIERNCSYLQEPKFLPYYISFFKETMAVSRSYQKDKRLQALLGSNSGERLIQVHTEGGSYPIFLGRGLLAQAAKLLSLQNRKVMIVTDDGVPASYIEDLQKQIFSCQDSSDSVINNVETDKATACFLFCFTQGESSKNQETLQSLLKSLSENHFTRTDCILAVGGGVVSDLAGFAAGIYLRGIDCFNIPTTLLAQVDASIGGKTAIDFDGFKNTVGLFSQPKAVLIDPQVLSTLPERQFSSGLAEIIKMSLTHDASLFSLLEQNDPKEIIDLLIYRSLLIKQKVVEADWNEQGERRVLNFGHTLAHAIESSTVFSLLHGEAVALGMLPLCSAEVRARLLPVLEKAGLPTHWKADERTVPEAMRHDKKLQGNNITLVYVPAVGSYEFKTVSCRELGNIFHFTTGKGSFTDHGISL